MSERALTDSVQEPHGAVRSTAPWLDEILRTAGDISTANAAKIQQAAEYGYRLSGTRNGDAWAQWAARHQAKSALADLATESDPFVEAALKAYREAREQAERLYEAARDPGGEPKGTLTPEGLAFYLADHAAVAAHEAYVHVYSTASQRHDARVSQAWRGPDISFLRSHRAELEAADPGSFRNILATLLEDSGAPQVSSEPGSVPARTAGATQDTADASTTEAYPAGTGAGRMPEPGVTYDPIPGAGYSWDAQASGYDSDGPSAERSFPARDWQQARDTAREQARQDDADWHIHPKDQALVCTPREPASGAYFTVTPALQWYLGPHSHLPGGPGREDFAALITGVSGQYAAQNDAAGPEQEPGLGQYPLLGTMTEAARLARAAFEALDPPRGNSRLQESPWPRDLDSAETMRMLELLHEITDSVNGCLEGIARKNAIPAELKPGLLELIEELAGSTMRLHWAARDGKAAAGKRLDNNGNTAAPVPPHGPGAGRLPGSRPETPSGQAARSAARRRPGQNPPAATGRGRR